MADEAPKVETEEPKPADAEVKKEVTEEPKPADAEVKKEEEAKAVDVKPEVQAAGDSVVESPAGAAAAHDLGSATAKSVLKQVEFYFSDANFVRDQFLREKAAEDAEGFVKLSVLLSFNRLKALSTDEGFIAAVLRQSSSLVVSEDSSAVRRASPPPGLNDSLPRSVFADGLPKDANLESIQALFGAFGAVLYVKMRRDKATKDFIGSVFVEMASREEAQAVVAKSTEVKWEGEPLKQVTMMDEWVQALKDRKRGDRKRPRDGNATEGGAAASGASFDPVKREMTEGLVVAIKGLGGECRREDIKSALGASLEEHIDWIDYRQGEEEAQVRFKTPDSAKLGLAGLEGFVAEDSKEDIGGCKPEKVWQLEGEEEKAYWNKTWDERDARRKSRASGGNKRRRSNGGQRGGKGHWGKRRRQ